MIFARHVNTLFKIITLNHYYIKNNIKEIIIYVEKLKLTWIIVK